MTDTPEPLAKVYDPRAIEPDITRSWLDGGCFDADPDDRPPEKRFTIVIPPPNVTGALHLGHAIDNVLQDVLIRWKRMSGFNTLWVPGSDHAGIATQAVVERRLLAEEGLTRHELGREKLVKRIWDWKDEYERRIIGQLKTMGCSCDWRRKRFTLDEQCARAVRHTFFRLFKDGLIYRGTRLVNWDTHLQTAVADDEVYHETVKSHFWHIRYPLKDPGPNDPEYVVVATTRPETMLGDTAVAVNPHDDRYKNLVGKTVILPLAEREIPIIADDWADPKKGSGCVKITPGHDPNDYEVGKRHSLEMINILHVDGTISPEALRASGCDDQAIARYRFKTVQDARTLVVADLEDRKLIEKIEDIESEVGHSDRSKTPIEPFLSLQWFVRMDKLAQTAMDAVTDGRVKFHPARYANTYLDWLGEKRDWCISRQLWWGHRIPIWYCVNCERKNGNLFEVEHGVSYGAPTDSYEKHAYIFTEEAKPIVGPDADTDPTACPECGGANLVQDPDVLDTWFSSQLWPHSTLGWPNQTPELEYYYPTSVLVTSRDIITLWVARMVLSGLYNCNQVPFTDVYIHCKILDGQGRGMSKQAGNGVDPLDIIEKYGTDALRYTMTAMATDTQDVRIPVKPETMPDGRIINTSEKFEIGRNFCNKLWNAARFAFMNLPGTEFREINPQNLPIEDRWILSALSVTARDLNRSLADFQFSKAMSLARDFFWNCLCDWYLELVKTRIAEGRQPAEAKQVLAACLDQTLRLLHPMLPFITEHLWRRLNEIVPRRGLPGYLDCPSCDALVLAAYPPEHGWPALIDEPLGETFEHLQEITRGVRDVRMRRNIPPRQTVNVLVKPAPGDVESLRQAAYVIHKLAGIGELAIDDRAVRPPDSCSVVAGTVQVFVLDCVDDARERERLGREIAEVERLIASKETKLSNENFVRRAPAEVVQQERDRLADLQVRRGRLRETLAQIEGR
jgi:valyl-tRNA synthetase